MKRVNYLYAVIVSACIFAAAGYYQGPVLGFWLGIIGVIVGVLVMFLISVMLIPTRPVVRYRVLVMSDGSKFILAPNKDQSSYYKCIHKGKKCTISTFYMTFRVYEFYIDLPEIPYLVVEQSAKTDEIVSPTDGPHSHL